jgi:hypothetical protein
MGQVFLTTFAGGDKFFFNISAAVGPNCPNKIEDFQLVQFGYFALAQNQGNPIPDDLRQAAAAVVPGADYDGSDDDPLTIAIRTDQQFRGGTQDGKVSRMHGQSTFYDAEHVFLLARLVNNIRVLLGATFPRIDKHPKCPPVLAASVKTVFDVS